MKKFKLLQTGLVAVILVFALSCQKDAGNAQQSQTSASLKKANPQFNLEVILRGEGNQFGLVKFRQDVDPSKIVTLDVWVRNLEPNHEYLLQRAVDAANVVDGNCTSTTWLTLGKGLVPQSILTDNTGMGTESLWRNISMLLSGTAFDIHFRVVDKETMAEVMVSDCYTYVVR